MKTWIGINGILLVVFMFKPANEKVLFLQYLYDNNELGNNTIVARNKDYYEMMVGLKSTFYWQENNISYCIEPEEGFGEFLRENKIDTCFYIHSRYSFKENIEGYRTEKVFSVYPDIIERIPGIDEDKIKTDCVILISKIPDED